jgi:lysophospholipase L1-like esterase
MNKMTKLLSIFFAATAFLTQAAEKHFELHDGDVVVFYGDSITDQRLYTTFTETYAVTRFPGMNVKFVHSGWGGDTVRGGGGGPIDTRLDRDVITYKPTVMTIMLGMNDASYRAFDEAIFQRYSNGYEHILDKVKKALPGLRLTLIQPSPFDDVTQPPKFEGGYNKVLVRYGDFVKDLSEKEHTRLADLNTPVVAALQKAFEKEPETARKIIADRVHPGGAGQLLMAAALLNAWNAPAEVSTVEIDGGTAKIIKSSNTVISDLKNDGSLRWQQTDKALPMPVDMKDPVMALAVRSSDFVQALNQEVLKVKGFSGEKARLSVDGNTVGTFTKEQLESGVNLAELVTPMSKQAQEVHRLTLQHNDLHALRWRQVQVKNAASERLTAALNALDGLEDEIVEQQRKAAKPQSRLFELKAE